MQARAPRYIQNILSKYDLRISKVDTPQSGYRNTAWPIELENGKMANLIIYKAEPGILAKINAANATSNYLAGEGFPARHTIDPRILTLRSATRTRYAALYNYLPGETIPWEAYTRGHIKAVGSAMGQMHLALEQMPMHGSRQNHITDSTEARLPRLYVEFGHIVARMQTYFTRLEVQGAMRTKLGLNISSKSLTQYHQLLKYCRGLPHQQPLHMDFVRGNILFEQTPVANTIAGSMATITGIIDFEKAALGHPVADIARTLAFLLVDCDKPEAKIRKYFLHSGYEKRGNAPIRYPKLLEPLLNLFLTYDFYKFLRHNPYESLEQNHHFVRTRDLLTRRGMIE